MANAPAIVAAPDTCALLEEAESIGGVGSWVSFLGPPSRLVWSKQCAAIFGLTFDTPMTPEGLLAMVHEDDRPWLVERRNAAIEHGAPYDVEFRIRRADGEVRWVRARASVSRDESGRPARFSGVLRDITEDRRTLDALRASEARYRSIVETSAEGVWIIDTDDRTCFVNARMAQILQREPAEILGRTAVDFVDRRYRASVAKAISLRRKGGPRQLEIALLPAGGGCVWTLVEATPIFDESGVYLGALAMVTDVTERRKTEAKLLESEARFARLSECGIIGISIGEIGGRVLEANDAFLRILGRTSDEVRAGQVHWHDHVAAGNVAALRATVQLLESGVAQPYEVEVQRRDGSRVPVMIGASMLEYPKVIGFVADLTDKRQAELALARSEEKLRQAQKMEAIGRLAGGVAHDFNNLLSVILSYTQFSIEDLSRSDPMRADLEQVMKAAQRASDLTRHLLAFSRRQVLEPRVLDLNETIAGMEKMLRRLLGEDVQLSLALAPSIGKVNADPSQFEQVVMNLVVNARDAMPTGGTLVIETAAIDLDDACAEAHEGARPGPHVRISVTDTGTGMDRATQARIFEPFFTTKEMDKGTGLGLSTVLGVVQQSGGHVTVWSEPGKGSRFEIFLPRAEAAAPEELASSAPPTVRLSGSETILLVEDEEQVRGLAATILRRNGYEILEASNAGEALLIAEEHEKKIDLLLTDVVMPRLSGPQIAERIRRARPDIGVLYMSGYPGEAIAPHGILESGVILLQKPLRPDPLLRKVREVLDAA